MRARGKRLLTQAIVLFFTVALASLANLKSYFPEWAKDGYAFAIFISRHHGVLTVLMTLGLVVSTVIGAIDWSRKKTIRMVLRHPPRLQAQPRDVALCEHDGPEGGAAAHAARCHRDHDERLREGRPAARRQGQHPARHPPAHDSEGRLVWREQEFLSPAYFRAPLAALWSDPPPGVIENLLIVNVDAEVWRLGPPRPPAVLSASV